MARQPACGGRIPMRGLLLPLLALALTLPLLAPVAAAQDGAPPDVRVEGQEVWEDDRTLEGRVVVANDSVLTIRGARVTLNETAFLVEPTGLLVVESLPGDPAVLTTDARAGWNASVRGRLELRGLPSDPVVVERIGGTSGASGASVVLVGGLAVPGGEVDARHVAFRTYGSGVSFGSGANATFEDVSFASTAGLGVLVTSANLTMSNATFAGPGATLFAGLPAGPVRLSNLTFSGTSRAMVLRAALDVDVSDVRVDGAFLCLDLVGPTSGSIRNLTCTDYVQYGVRIGPAEVSPRLTPNVTISGLRISTTNATAKEAFFAARPRGLTLEDVEIGPIPYTAAYVSAWAPRLDRVTFHDVAGWNLVLASPPGDVPRGPPADGTPGGEGWMLVTQDVTANVRMPDATAAPHAKVLFRAGDGREVKQTTNDAGTTPTVPLETGRVDASGAYKETTYSVEATSADGTHRATREGYVPDGTALVLQLEAVAAGGNRAPGAPVAALVVGVVLLALARRRA